MIKIGTDVEFALFNVKKRTPISITNFEKIFNGGKRGAIGRENEDIGEFRPKPSTSGITLARNLFRLMKDTTYLIESGDIHVYVKKNLLEQLNFTLKDIIITGGNIGGFQYANDIIDDYYNGWSVSFTDIDQPMGGHIHISNSDYISNNNAEIIEGILLLLSITNSNLPLLRKRYYEGYGGNISPIAKPRGSNNDQNNSKRFELKIMPSQLNCIEILPALYEFIKLITTYLIKSKLNINAIKIIRRYNSYSLYHIEDKMIKGLRFISRMNKSGKDLNKVARNILYDFFNDNEDIKNLSIWIEIMDKFISSSYNFDEISCTNLYQQRDKLEQLLSVTKTKNEYINFILDFLEKDHGFVSQKIG